MVASVPFAKAMLHGVLSRPVSRRACGHHVSSDAPRIAFRPFCCSLFHRFSGFVAHCATVVHTHVAVALAHLFCAGSEHLCRHVSAQSRFIPLLGFPFRNHTFLLFPLFARRRFGQCERLVCGVGHRRGVGAGGSRVAADDEPCWWCAPSVVSVAAAFGLQRCTAALCRSAHSSHAWRAHRFGDEYRRGLFQCQHAAQSCGHQSRFQFVGKLFKAG